MAEPVVIALLGAQGTGKSTLAAALARRLAAETGLRCTWVAEWQREWCEREGRAPRVDELAAIAREQHRRIEAAAAAHDVVLCDTTALATAVHSRLVFGDASLEAPAVELHRARVQLSLLTALDMPWSARGPWGDGERREPIDEALRRLLHAHRLPWVVVAGLGPRREEAALDAIAALLRRGGLRRPDLFTRLAQREAAARPCSWTCDKCDQPDCEHASLRRPG